MIATDRRAVARAAVERGDWDAALEALGEGASRPTDAEGLELAAMAAYGAGDLEASVAAWEALHDHFVAEDDSAEAARAAAMIAMYLMMDTGLMAPVRGWLARAERLLAGRDDVPAHALVAMTRTYERFMCGDMDEADRQSAIAIESGERLGVQPAVVIGRTAGARVRILSGDVAGGLAQLDEVGALLMSGGADPLTTGMMYCELICAAQGLALLDRAREWTEVMDHWRHDAAFGGINGRCRVHRAEMLRISGPCDLAEEEALGACDELRPWMRREYGWPLAELGNIRLRKGDLDGAEEAYLAAHEHAWSPHPGLALVRLARGDVDAAAALITEAVTHPARIPSKERPPFGDLCAAPLLDAQVEIAVAAADLDTARGATEALVEIAERYASPALAASAALAEARTALLAGDLERAIGRAKAAISAWATLGAPFETAMGRLVLGEAHRRAGHVDAAHLEWRSARRAFEAFGARRRADEAARLVADAEAKAPPAAPEPTPGEVTPDEAAFLLEGDLRVVGLGGSTVRLRDLKGFRYLERLVAEPGREFHVLDLVAVEAGTLGTGLRPGVDTDTTLAGGGLPVIDEQARAAYRRRLQEVDEDIEDATRCNDPERAELARRDRDYLIAELSRAVGLGGRHRSVGSDAERARTSVARSVRYALGRLAEHHPAAATHLAQGISTGVYCSFTPDPLGRVHWRVGYADGSAEDR